MNNLQKIAYEISGYNPLNEEVGARNDYYYEECHSSRQKINFVKNFCFDSDDFEPVTEAQAGAIVGYLESRFTCSDNWYHAFKELGEKL